MRAECVLCWFCISERYGNLSVHKVQPSILHLKELKAENKNSPPSYKWASQYTRMSHAGHEAALRKIRPKGGSFACRSNREVMLCVHLILLLSIVPPLVSTGCFQCSIKSAAWKALRQYQTFGRERLQHLGSSRRLRQR